MRRLLTVLVLACAAAGLPAPALAHNVLVGSDPKDGATLSSAPDRITLVFDQPARQGYAQVSVTGPDGSARVDDPAVVAAEKVTVKVRPLPANGAYTVGYRILSADGHPVTGKITFTLQATAPAPSDPPAAQPADPAATAAPTDRPAPDAPAPTAAPGGSTVTATAPPPADEAQRAEAYEAAANGGAGMAVVWIVGALLLLAAGTAVALRRSRTTADTRDAPAPGTAPPAGARPGVTRAGAPDDEGTGA
ncbi:copper resistance CopC family protein [Nonomuraea sp. NPDC047897]|uniref:copper resistance CopC family protein n=1 Tax=Nonomuraea sp. NPDC047897 TaxID=3364346 RepID=UPI003715271B